MKKLFTILALAISAATHAQSVGINTTPAASAALDVSSTTKGMLVPRMTTAQRNAIATPATGLMVYDITLNAFYYWNGTAWTAFGGNSYPNIEVSDDVTSQQTFSIFDNASSAPYSAAISFSGTNSANASLTGGDTWNGTKFTAGTAGWYEVQVQMNTGSSGSNAPSIVGVKYLLDKNDVVGTSTRLAAYAYSSYDYDANGSATAGIKTSNSLHAIIYLASGDFINLKGWSISTNASAYNTTDGSSNITIVRLK